ncbi:hypothetical protein [Parafrankia sp. EUN1f]|uniref:hypothetical protein n=1 Tax=Parafrankia sp. EUN1f TaxID=102897 RepID=UPI0012F7D931|nr:hypothetical protein [Parafrankia sp. EUN1f]
MNATVIGLGAWCDYVPESDPRVLRFQVEEFAVLSDGRRLTLTADRGWSSSLVGSPTTDDAWSFLTLAEVTETVLVVVGPDEGDQTTDAHPWALLAERLRAQDVDTTPGALRDLPYEVVLSERLQARISST